LFTIKHIWAGVGFAGLGAVVVASGWISGTPQTTEARKVEAQSAGRSTGAPTPSPASLTQPTGRNDEKKPPTPAQAPDLNEQATNEQAAQLLAPAPLPPTPRWAASFAQQDGQTAGAITNNGSIERHLTWTQIDLLDEIAGALPKSAPDWLTIECAADRESHTFAKEIHEVFSISQRIKALNVRATEPVARGVFVTASSQTDEHFYYAQLIARVLNTPASPVHFGPPKDPKPGIVKIMILAAEPMPPTEQARNEGR